MKLFECVSLILHNPSEPQETLRILSYEVTPTPKGYRLNKRRVILEKDVNKRHDGYHTSTESLVNALKRAADVKRSVAAHALEAAKKLDEMSERPLDVRPSKHNA